MSVASKLLRALGPRPSPLRLHWGSYFCVGYGCTVGSVGGPIDPDMEAISEGEALPYVTWNLPKDGFVALLKRHLPKISSPF